MKIFRLLMIFFLISGPFLMAQGNNKDVIFNEKEQIEKVSHKNSMKREIYFNKQRAYPGTEIPEGARIKAFNQLEKMKFEKNSSSLMLAQQPEWKNIGPFSIGGRIKSIVCHPTKNGTIYIGAAAGGVWKSTDFGANWEPIFDFENAIAFGSLAIDMNAPEILYAGTGEAVMGGNAYLGSGMYKTTDEGKTWKVIGLTSVGAFSKVWVHPRNSNLILAGATKRAQGFYRSTDAGETWEKTYEGTVSDVSINISNESEILIGVTGGGIYFSNDTGKTFVARNTGLESGIGRVSVQFAPSNPDIAYALMEIMGIGTIYRSTDHGKGWVTVYKGSDAFFNGQGFYDNYIVVHPTSPNVALAGGIDIFRTINGTSWTNVTNGYSGGSVHVDQHHACFNPLNPNNVYAGNDGALYQSNDAGLNGSVINNNLQVSQFYSLAIDMTKENITFGGTQDNGTLGSNATQNQWQRVAGGDGFRTIVDYSNPNIIYGETTPSGGIAPFKLDLKTGNFSYLTKGLNLAESVWDPPLVMDPNDSYMLYHGRKNLYASYDNGDSWDVISPSYTQGRYMAVAASPVDGTYIVAGTEIGEVIFSTDGGTKWTEVTGNGLVNRWVRDFAFSRVDKKTCIVVYSGFGVPHVFKTTDAGKSWKNISEGLPDVPTNTVAIHPLNEDMIFIGTDIGVFATFDGGNSWFPYGRGLSRSPVTDLEFNDYYIGQESIPLRAATHGRSMWQVDVTSAVITSPEIVAPTGGELYTSGTPQVVSWYGFTPPVTVEYSANDGLTWNKIADNVQGKNLRWIIPNRPTINGRVRISSVADPSQVRISNTFTIMLIDVGSILKMGGVSFIPYGIAYDGKNGLWSTSFQTNKLTKLNADNFVKEKEFTLPGDSLYSDLTIDRTNGTVYIHRMNSTQGNGGMILVVDTTGKSIRQFKSPGLYYPIGLELVDGNLLCGDRDFKNDLGERELYLVSTQNGAVISKFPNPYQKTYGPRGLCYDGSQYVYQVCTDFPNGGLLNAAYLMRIDKNNLSAEVSSMKLESLDGNINARGADYDPRDQNFWVSDYGGNIYKVAGFETVVNVEEDRITEKGSLLETKIYPNPVSDFANISVKLLTEKPADVQIRVYNILGEQVKLMMDKSLSFNEYGNATFSASDLTSGVYNVVFFVDGKQDLTRKLVIMK